MNNGDMIENTNSSLSDKKPSIKASKKIVLIGMLSATITSGKIVLSAIPNVEIVTLLIMAYTIVFGLSISLPTTLIFVTTEMLIYGLNSWVLSYYIHWSLIAIVTALVYCIFSDKHMLPYIISATILTAFFGVLTSLIDVLMFANSGWSNFWDSFTLMYVRGVYFYAIHIVSTTIVVALGLYPIVNILKKIGKSFLYKH